MGFPTQTHPQNVVGGHLWHHVDQEDLLTERRVAIIFRRVRGVPSPGPSNLALMMQRIKEIGWCYWVTLDTHWCHFCLIIWLNMLSIFGWSRLDGHAVSVHLCPALAQVFQSIYASFVQSRVKVAILCFWVHTMRRSSSGGSFRLWLRLWDLQCFAESC